MAQFEVGELAVFGVGSESGIRGPWGSVKRNLAPGGSFLTISRRLSGQVLRSVMSVISVPQAPARSVPSAS